MHRWAPKGGAGLETSAPDHRHDAFHALRDYVNDFLLHLPDHLRHDPLASGADATLLDNDQDCLHVFRALVSYTLDEPPVGLTHEILLPVYELEGTYCLRSHLYSSCIVDVLHSLPWSAPDQVQLFAREPGDPAYRLVRPERDQRIRAIEIQRELEILIRKRDTAFLVELLAVGASKVRLWVQTHLLPLRGYSPPD